MARQLFQLKKKIQEKALKGYEKGEVPINCRPAEVIESEIKDSEAKSKNLALDEEDLILFAMYPVTGEKFLKWKYGKEEPPNDVKPITMEEVRNKDELVKKALEGKLISRKTEYDLESKNIRKFNIFIDNDVFEVGVNELNGDDFFVDSKTIEKSKEEKIIKNNKEKKKKKEKKQGDIISTVLKGKIVAPMPGMIVKYNKKVGEKVLEGESAVVLEAMKMENSLTSPIDGIIKNIKFEIGDSVNKGDTLCEIE